MSSGKLLAAKFLSPSLAVARELVSKNARHSVMLARAMILEPVTCRLTQDTLESGTRALRKCHRPNALNAQSIFLKALKVDALQIKNVPPEPVECRCGGSQCQTTLRPAGSQRAKALEAQQHLAEPGTNITA